VTAETFYRCPLCGRLVLEYSACPRCYDVVRELLPQLVDEATTYAQAQHYVEAIDDGTDREAAS